MVAYTFRMPAGIPGEPNRSQSLTIEPASITPTGTTGAPTAYGIPVVIDNTGGNVGNVRSLAAGDQAGGVIYGILIRPYPTQSSQDPLGTSTPPTQGQCDVLKRGYVTVKLNTGTAVKGGPVAIWTAATAAPHVQGGFEQNASIGTNGFVLANAYFMGPADSNGNVEIAYNL